MICQQQTVAEDAPATRTILPAAGLLSFYFFAAAAVVTALAAAWAVIAAASFGFSLSSAAVEAIIEACVIIRGIEPLWTQKNGADNRLIFYFRFIKLELFL